MLELKKGVVCPQCEEGKLRELKKDLKFNYKGDFKVFPNETVLTCSVCDYEGLTSKANKKIEKDLTDFRRSIEGLLSSDEMKYIRENLCLNKKQMAELLALNDKTIGRYECGKIIQSQQIDKLYRIYIKHPSIVKQAFPSPVTFRFHVVAEVKSCEVGHNSSSPKNKYTYSTKSSPQSILWGAEYAKAA